SVNRVLVAVLTEIPVGDVEDFQRAFPINWLKEVGVAESVHKQVSLALGLSQLFHGLHRTAKKPPGGIIGILLKKRYPALPVLIRPDGNVDSLGRLFREF